MGTNILKINFEVMKHVGKLKHNDDAPLHRIQFITAPEDIRHYVLRK